MRVTLTGTAPDVWRLVQVSAEMTLAELSVASAKWRLKNQQR